MFSKQYLNQNWDKHNLKMWNLLVENKWLQPENYMSGK